MVHRKEEMKCYAEKLGINVPFIPPGLTDELQPLDRFLFGPMKATCRRTNRAYMGVLGVMNKQIVAGILVRAGEVVSPEVLDEAWAIYDDFDQREGRGNMTNIYFILLVFLSCLFRFSSSLVSSVSSSSVIPLVPSFHPFSLTVP
jgi:hypothetical protein